MDAKTRRVLKQKQGRITSGSGAPSVADGIEGQVQVREVNGQPTLFARLNGKWLESPLASGGNFFVPKAFAADIILPSAAGKPCFVIPHFIPLKNILHMSVILESSTASETFFRQLPEGYHGLGAASDWLLAIKSSTRQIYLSRIGDPTYVNKKAKLTILYK